VDELRTEGISSELREEAFAVAVEAVSALGDEGAISDLEVSAAALPRVLSTPLIMAGRARLQALLAHRQGEASVAQERQSEAVRLLRALGARPLLARALADQAQLTGDSDALAEARAVYSELGATRWLERRGAGSEVTA
jgi:hypothetical protein